MSSPRISSTPLPCPTPVAEGPAASSAAAASPRAPVAGDAPRTGSASRTGTEPRTAGAASVCGASANTLRAAGPASSAANTVSAAGPERTAPPALPRAVPTGTHDYYVERARDFEARNPGLRAPDYYLAYGERYIGAFSALGPEDLSPAGLAWRDAVRAGLQRAIEARRREDPEAFARLERDPQALRSFAFGTHAPVYLEAGLLELPAQDLASILLVPDLRDLLSDDGLRQAREVLQATRPEDVAAVLDWTVNEALRRAARLGDEASEALDAGRARLQGAAVR